MSDTKPPRTVRDALIVEAIGDIGELIKRIEDLDTVTGSIILKFEQKLLDSVSMVEKHANDKQGEFHHFTESERQALEEKLHTSVEKVAKHLEHVGHRLVREVGRPVGLSVWAQLGIALAIASLASVISIYGSFWMFGREQDAQATVGKAVLTVWNELDEKTKARIEQEY